MPHITALGGACACANSQEPIRQRYGSLRRHIIGGGSDYLMIPAEHRACAKTQPAHSRKCISEHPVPCITSDRLMRCRPGLGSHPSARSATWVPSDHVRLPPEVHQGFTIISKSCPSLENESRVIAPHPIFLRMIRNQEPHALYYPSSNRKAST